MYQAGTPEFMHHIATYGTQDKFGYKDFIPNFKAERFDPVAWAELFKKAGAKYVVPVAEHHDGFAMYDSGVSDWTAAKMGPHRDVIGDLSKAVRTAGLHFGVSSHRVEHNFFLGVGRTFSSDINDPQYPWWAARPRCSFAKFRMDCGSFCQRRLPQNTLTLFAWGLSSREGRLESRP